MLSQPTDDEFREAVSTARSFSFYVSSPLCTDRYTVRAETLEEAKSLALDAAMSDEMFVYEDLLDVELELDTEEDR